MSNVEHDNDAGLADFLAAYGRINTGDPDERLTGDCGLLIALTNFGERPIPSTRLAEVLGRPVRQAEALARRGGPITRVENGLITVDPERAKPAARRRLRIGDRRFGVTGCGFDVFLYAHLIRPSLQLEEICTVTGTPIRIVFTPGGVEDVDPSGAVLPLPGPQMLDRIEGMTSEDIDASVCVQMSLFASAEAARGWLAGHPGGRVFPITEVWDLSFYQDWRDRTMALLNLQN